MSVRSLRVLAQVVVLCSVVGILVFSFSQGTIAQSTYTPGFAADLLVTQDGPSVVNRGSVFGYNVAVSNQGPGIATGIVATADIPPGFLFEPGASDARCRQTGQKVVCDVPDLRTGNPFTFRIAYRTPFFDACVDTTVAHVVKIEAYEQDPNPANNRSQDVTTTVTCGAPSTQCTDRRDNDADGRVDERDAGCHSDLNAANANTYRPQGDDETLDQQEEARLREEERQRQRIQMRQNRGRPLPPPPPVRVLPPLPPPVFPVPPAPARRATRDLAVALRASHSEAQPGDSVSYTVVVRNVGDRPLAELDVVSRYPEGSLSVDDPGSAAASPGELRWTVPSLLPRQSRTLSYSVTLSPTLRHGDSVSQTVQVYGGSNVPASTATVAIIQALPQTGIADFTAALENSRRFLSPLRGIGAGSALAFVAAFSALATGGMLAAKRKRTDA